MSDIFISYSSADRERARRVADALHARGWSIWWDRAIPPGRQYDEVIDEALTAARCVVVLWTQASTTSSWVKNEASDAMERRLLIPAVLDAGIKIPLEFRRVQAADLSRWRGEASSPEFDLFCSAIASIVPPSNPTPAPAPAPGPWPAPPAPMPAPPAPTPAPAPRPPAPMPAPPGPGPAPVPPEPARTGGGRKLAVWIGAIAGALVVGGLLLENEYETQALPSPMPATTPMPAQAPSPMPATTPMPAPVPAPLPVATASAGSMPLAWRDNALRYAGTLSWDGRSSSARVAVVLSDLNTGASLGSREVDAPMRLDAPGRVVFTTVVAVGGDSETPGPHTHAVNLVFELQPAGHWMFVRNCMAPGNCWEAGR